MRKFKRKLAQILTGAGAGIITASTILPGTIAGATENGLIANIGETLEVESGDINEYIVGDEKIEYAQKSIGEEDVYAVSYNDEDVEGEEKALISEGLIDSEEETTIAAAIKKLEAESEEVSYADVQSIVWTVETEEKVYPVNTINTEALESVYASIDDGSVLDSITGVTSVSAKSDKNEYVVFYYMPQVTEINETIEAITETTAEVETPVVEVESNEELVKEIAESVEAVQEEVKAEEESKAEVIETAIENSGTTEISETVDVELEEKIEEDKEKKAELEETKYMLSTNFLVINSDSKAKTIDGVYKDSPDDVLMQHSGDVPLYDNGDGYYVGFINSTDMNEHFSDIIDIQIGFNDVSGTLINDASFKDNVIKIPSKYFTETQYNNIGYEIENKIVPVKAQFMVKYDDTENTESTVNIEIENNTNFKVNDVKSIKANDNDISFDIPLSADSNLSLDNIDVYLDNSEYAENKGLVGVTYNDGVLTIPQSSILINNVKIVIRDKSVKNIAKTYIDEFNGIKVTAEAQIGAFPEGTTMVLGEVAPANVDDIIDSVEENASINVKNKKAIDISFELNGEEIEPANGKLVNVKLDFADSLIGERYAIIHKHEDKVNLISTNVDENSAEFVVDKFSEFVAIAADGSNIQSLAKLLNVDKNTLIAKNNGQWMDFHMSISYRNSVAKSGRVWDNASRLYGTSGQNAFTPDVMYGLMSGVPLGQYQHRNDAPTRNDDEGFTARVGAYDANSAQVGMGDHPEYVIPYAFYMPNALKDLGILEGKRFSDDIINNMNVPHWSQENANYINYFGAIGEEAAYSAPLYCSHTSVSGLPKDYSDADGVARDTHMKAKILYLNTEADQPYVVMGFISGTIDNDSQEACGIYKFDLEFKEENGRIRIKKDSNQPDAVAGGSNGQHYEGYSLAGAKFGIYRDEACTDFVTDLTTGEDSYTGYATVPAGTYWIKELNAPEGHIPNETPTKVDVVAQSGDYNGDDTSTYNLVHVVNNITTTTFKIHKTSSDPATSNGNSSYSLAGAEFKIYNSKEAAEKDDKDAWSYTFTTDESGNTNVLTGVWKGTYYIREMKAPAGFKVDKEIKEVKVLEDTTFEFSDEPGNGGITLKKTSSDPTITNGNDCYSLAGGVFGVYKTEKDANQKVNEVDKLITKADGTSNTISGLPLGTYFVKELTAPKGYNLNRETKKVTINTIGQTATVEFADVPGKDPSNLVLKKVDDSGNVMPGVSMAGAEFKVTYYNNSKWEGKGTEYTITTNAQGIAELSNKLPAGTFTVQETKAPTGYKLDNQIYKGSIKVLEDGTVKIDNLLQDKVAVNAKDDNVFEIKNERKPEGSTDAIDKNTGVQSGVVGTTTITDTFTYKNLYEGRTYTLDGVLLDKETGKPLLVDGKEIRVTKEFTPTSPNGKVTIDFEVKTTALAGKSTVVGETLKQDGKEVIVHVDVNDKRQEVKFPSVGTKAIDKNSGIQAGVNAKTTYVDTVSYTNLDVGSEYKVTGVLMDKETGKELTINGKTVTGSQTFTPSAENGTVKVEFNIDASSLANKSVVVFEKLYIIKKDGTEVEVGKHENINDGGQEIATPEVGTSAKDFQTKNHTAVVGKTTLIDTVNYKNLIPNKEYTMTGTLMDKETGKPVVVDGKTITNSATFTPSERSGSIEIKFEFDTSSLEGKDTVFYEKLFYNGVELTSHENPEDDEQKIDIPKIRTTAIDGQTKNHTGVTGQTTIVDTVKYENLTVGQTYVMEGVLMDKVTGKELTVAGKTVTATQEFTPKTQDGTVDVTFTLDASDLKGKDVVVFETLMQGKVKITEHKSINDKGQTVNYAEVRTKAINKETQNQTNTAVGKTTILDTVSYKNLTVGQKYVMQGKLVDKATGEFLKNEAGEDIVNRIEFEPKQPTGMVEVPIEVDTSILHGKKIVVFEKLYQDDIEVTAHEDIEDIPQNTEVPTLKTTATDIQTGNHTGVAEETTIVDDVEYTGLTIGQKYIVKGVLMDKTTGEPVVIDGKEIISEQEFVVGEDVEYTHPSMTKEEATDEVKEETEEEIKEDTKEEVKEDTKEEVKEEDKEEDTEEAYEPIEGVTSDGTVKLFYDLNARELKGHQVVVFETLYQIPNDTEEAETPVEDETTTIETEPVKIISHEDIEDEGQTVDIPDAQTTATDKNTTTHTAVVGKTTIVDEVRFTGLTVGETYTFKGVLVDKETGEPLVQDGKEVTAEAEMVAETKDGSQLLEFEVDTEVIAGRSVVAEEEVWYKDVMITDHKDLEDEDQTVNVPTIATTATGQNGKTVEYGSSVTIVDTVTYTNLTVGESYTMSGTMVDQNGNAVSNVESVPFVANSANGSVEVEFVIDTTAHAGEKLVAFEELTAQNGTKITEHKDLTDEGQTVYVNTPPEVPPTTYNPTPNTGNKSGVIMAAGIAGGTAIAAAGLALGKRKKRED